MKALHIVLDTGHNQITVSDLWKLEEIAEQRTGTHTPTQVKERC